MGSYPASKVSRLPVTALKPKPLHRMCCLLLGGLLATQALAGGANVSDDEIYTDGVTLTDWTGSPLDIDGDGNTDLAIAGNRIGAANSSRYYLGNGDGTFSAPVLLTEGRTSVIAAADLSGDMFVDLLQLGRDSTDILYLNDGAGGVDGGTDLSVETNRSLSVAFGDLDGDGDLDIVVGTGRAGGSNDPMIAAQLNRFYLNDLIPGGTTDFAGGDISPDADVARSIALVDIDGDGHLDVVSVSDSTTPNASHVYRNLFGDNGGTVAFDGSVQFGLLSDQTTKALIGDLDDDGDPDIVQLNFNGISRFFLNESTPGTVTLSVGTGVSADENGTNGGVLADFDGDGDLDLAVANFRATLPQSSRNRLYLNQFVETGTVSFAAGTDISADEHKSHQLAATDLNGDGHIDIVVGNEDAIPGVPGFDRRYLNNGTADPFTNVVPVIDAQVDVLATATDVALPLVLEDLSVTDPDNVFPADFTLTVQAGANYTVTDDTITPAAGFVGDLIVPVIVNDGTDDSEPFDLTVKVGAPYFTSTPVEEATEDVAYTYDVTATDPDAGAVLTISAATALPAWLTLTDNGDGTASLTGTPTGDDVAAHDISLEVFDGTVSGQQDFTITVAAANDPPTFTSTALTAASVGAAYTYNVTTSDPDVGDTLAITAATALPAWLALADDGDGTATLSGTPDAGDAGDHDVSLEVSDGTATAVQNFTITVAAAPPGNNAPTFTSTAVLDALEGTTYTYDVTTSDADAGDTLEITAPTLPAWLELNDNGDGTAVLTGTPAAANVGDHQVSLQVSDGTGTAVQDFTITVEADTTVPPPPPPPPSGGGGGGSLGLVFLVALCTVGAVGRRRRIV